MENDLKKIFDSFKDYKFNYSQEDIMNLLANDLLVCSTLGALKKITMKYLVTLTGKEEPELEKEYLEIYTDTFTKLYADFVSKRGVPG